jgi:hypothetical protein
MALEFTPSRKAKQAHMLAKTPLSRRKAWWSNRGFDTPRTHNWPRLGEDHTPKAASDAPGLTLDQEAAISKTHYPIRQYGRANQQSTHYRSLA